MANLEALPNELLARIVSFSDRKSLAQLRLTVKRLEPIAVERLFERVTLYAHWAKTEYDERFPEQLLAKENGTVGGSARVRQDLNFNDEDGFVAGSDLEDDDVSELGVVGGTGSGPRRLSDNNARHNCSTFDDDDDGFIPASDSKELEGDTQVDIPSRPDPFSRRDSDYKLYETQEKETWEAIRPHWARRGYPGPPNYDANMFKIILENDTLRKYVKEVQVYTCETHCDHHPKTGAHLFKDSSWPQPDFDPVYQVCAHRLDEFPNLSSVVVHFDRHGPLDWWDEDVFQAFRFLPSWLESIFDKLDDKAIRSVSVRHYENPEMADMPIFFNKVHEATELRLSVKHQELHPGAVRYVTIHPFWQTFPIRFLQPASATLKTLVLYSDIPLGWFPKLDLRDVHLPHLASLTMGHHIFHHSRQIDWITSYRATLRSLILDHCAILYQLGCAIPDWLDADGYPREDAPGNQFQAYGLSSDPVHYDDISTFQNDLFFQKNDLRWHTVFSRFASELPSLNEFRFGSSSQWDFDTPTRHFRAGAVTHIPIMPWADEHNMSSALFKGRYVVWDDWVNEYRSEWLRSDEHMRRRRGRGHFEDGWKEEWLVGLEGQYPECEQEDEDALRELLECVRGR